jgi:hypothetical protein
MVAMKPHTALVICAFVLLSPAARPAGADPKDPATAALKGDAARPEAAHWVRSELYFGAGPVDVPDGGLAEIRWRGFLDKEVTPRFPDGLTVFDAYGQWRDRGRDAPSRLWTKVLVILHEDTPENRAAIDAIRLAWKASTHDKSVLLVTEPVDISF